MAVVVSTVSETNRDNSIRMPTQRNSFYAAGRQWVSYSVYGSHYIRSTPDEVNWSDPILLGATIVGADLALWYDGQYAHYIRCRQADGEKGYYRRFLPQADGSIVWTSDEQVAWDGGPTGRPLDPSICVDSSGYPFIALQDWAGGAIVCLKSARNDGIWETDWSAILCTFAPMMAFLQVNLVPLTAGKVYVTYVNYGIRHLLGRLWDGFTLGEEEICSASDVKGSYGSWSTVAIGDDVHVVFTYIYYDLGYIKRTYGVGWGGEISPIATALFRLVAPALCKDGLDLVCFWLDTDGKVRYKRCSNEVWDTDPAILVDESIDGIRASMIRCIQCDYEVQDGAVGVVYETGLESPYLIRHALYASGVIPIPTYLLTIATVGEGTTEPTPGARQYSVGSQVIITATPAAGWQFSHWEGDVGGIINPLVFFMPSYDVTITAIFEEIPPIMHTVTIEVTGSGMTIPTVGDYVYAEGTAIDVTAIPDIGWKFDHWEGDASGTDNPISITVAQDMTVRAVFTEEAPPPTEHSVAISIVGQGTTDPAAGSYNVLDGNYLTITAYPTAGWQFDHWGGSILTTDNPVTVQVLADATIVAVFVEIVIPTHTVTIAVEGSGTTEPIPGAWGYEEGSQASITAIPTAGWKFARWTGDLPSTANPLTFTVTVDISVTAVFEEVVVPPEEYAVSISIVGQGSTAPAPDTYQVEAGATITITALPAEGWVFDHWGGDISSTDNPVQVVVNADVSVVAVFVEEPVTPPQPPWELVLAGMIVVGGLSVLTRAEM